MLKYTVRCMRYIAGCSLDIRFGASAQDLVTSGVQRAGCGGDMGARRGMPPLAATEHVILARVSCARDECGQGASAVGVFGISQVADYPGKV